MEHASETEVTDAGKHVRSLVSALNQVLFGQEELIELVITGVLSRGHILLEGLPGLGKTELVKGLSKTLVLDTKRIQFTPDLLPGDITGNPVLQEVDGKRVFNFQPGPLFTNIVLADEINRASPKTQSALLEAMQERHVTVLGKTHPLPAPFFVLATQNPIEQEGTYPLPEAQLDRFMFMIKVDYPSEEEEFQIMKTYTGNEAGKPDPVLTAEEILEMQRAVRNMPVADHIIRYAEKLVRVTRPNSEEALEFCTKWLTWGAGPRAGLNLVLAAKAHALLKGESHVSCDDIAAVAPPIFRHRIIPNFSAQSEGLTPDDITAKILESVPKDKKLD